MGVALPEDRGLRAEHSILAIGPSRISSLEVNSHSNDIHAEVTNPPDYYGHSAGGKPVLANGVLEVR